MSDPVADEPFQGSKRTVRATRTPANWKADTEPHRSQTLPPLAPTGVESHLRPTRTYTSGPDPNIIKQRVPSRTQRSAITTGISRENKIQPNSQTSSPYPTARAPEGQDAPWLSTTDSMPILDTRKSSSSFQTEPSSYYSADDDIPPSVPSMPEPKTEEDDSQNRYKTLWLTSQAESSAMPIPDVPKPNITSYRSKNDSTTSRSYRREGSADDDAPSSVPSIPEPETEDQDSENRHNTLTEGSAMPIPDVPTHIIPSYRTNIDLPASRSYRREGATAVRIFDPKKQSLDQTGPSSSPNDRHDEQNSVNSRSYRHDGDNQKPGDVARFPDLRKQSTDSSRLSSAPKDRYDSRMPAPPPAPTAITIPSPNTKHSGSRYQPSSLQPNQYSDPTPVPPRSPMRIHHQARPSPTSTSPSSPPGPTSITSVSHPTGIDSTKPPHPTSFQKTNFESRPDSSVNPAVHSDESQKSNSLYSQQSATNADPHNVSLVKGPVPPSSFPQPTSGLDTRPNTQTSPAPQKYTHSHTQPSVQYSQPLKPTGSVSSSLPPKPSPSQQPNSRPAALEQQRPSLNTEPFNQKQSNNNINVHEKDETPAPMIHGVSTRIHTQYVNMLLALDDIPVIYNLAASFFTWLLLAGFILFPGTFTSLKNVNTQNDLAEKLVHAVTHLPLFIVAWICTGAGASGMIWLTWRWRKNYLWGMNKIFLPGFMNSLAGLLSTLANIFGVQHGEFSLTSQSTLIVTSASTGVLGLLFIFYSLWLVRRVKARHDREVGKEVAGKHGEGEVKTGR